MAATSIFWTGFACGTIAMVGFQCVFELIFRARERSTKKLMNGDFLERRKDWGVH